MAVGAEESPLPPARCRRHRTWLVRRAMTAMSSGEVPTSGPVMYLQVRAVYVLTGNDDFLIHVAVPDLPALHGLLTDHFSKRREVIGFRTSVIYDYASQPLLTFPATE